MHLRNEPEVKNTERQMSDWECDLARYGTRRAFLREQSLWAVWLYRQGRRLDLRSPGFGKKWRTTLYWAAFRIVETITGVSLPKSASIGPGLRIWHFGNIFVHPDAKIGANCTLRQGVTIGNRHVDGPVPVLGDNVELGAYTQILGGVKIGNNCRIGAMTVVLYDMPDGSTAVGAASRLIPARVADSKTAD